MSFYSDTIKANQPVAYYRLNETSGNQAADSSGNGYTATLSGGFALGIACNVLGESAVQMNGTTGTLTLPPALNVSTWPTASLEFWIGPSSSTLQQVVVTMSATAPTLLYLNGQPYSSGSAGNTLLVDIDLFFAGSPMNGLLSSVSLYSAILTPAQIAADYAAGQTPGPAFVPRQNLFGIGTYQSMSGGTVIAGGFPTQAFQLTDPFAGTYGGTYGYVLDTRIRAPKMTVYTPAPLVGLDNTGIPVVRGYPTITWSYSSLRPDYWYYLLNTYNQAGRQPPGYQYLVLIQYPDLSGTNALVQQLARMNPPAHAYRTVGAYWSVTLTFTHVGQAVLAPSVPVVVLS